MYVPTTYNNTPTPVFLNFHGFLMTMNWQYELTGMAIVRAHTRARPAPSRPPPRSAPPPLLWTACARCLSLRVTPQGS